MPERKQEKKNQGIMLRKRRGLKNSRSESSIGRKPVQRRRQKKTMMTMTPAKMMWSTEMPKRAVKMLKTGKEIWMGNV